MPATFDVEVEHQLDELVQRGVQAISAATAHMSAAVREEHIPAEAPVGATGELASSWEETERDALTRVVHPGPEAFYAHIVARGRGPVETAGARALTIDGQFRAAAGPAAANPFHERALAAAEARTDEFIAEALAAEGFGS